LLHNTIVNWDTMICCNADHLLRSFARNNLWISATSGQIWDFGRAKRDWRTDLDYDGFDWGGYSVPFRYGGTSYSSLDAFKAASGLETNGNLVNKHLCFAKFDVSGPSPASVPQDLDLTLTAGCNAIDAGAILPNINDGFLGSAPDLGAYEFGQPQPVYGPR